MENIFEAVESTEENPIYPEKRKKNIRIVIADDHPIVRDGLKKLLALEEDFEVVGEAGDGREVLDRVQELEPDVLLLDLRMPNLDGLSALQALQQSNRSTKVIVLTASEDKNEFVQAMKLGCSRHRAEADRSGPDRKEYPQGVLRRNLAGFASLLRQSCVSSHLR